ASSMVAWSEGDLTMQSCYNAGSVRGEEPVCEFAFTEGKSLLNDCYDSFSYQVSHIRKTDVQSGALCFLLTEGRDDSPWRQNINNVRARDAFPVPIPSHGRVYKDGAIYTNINPKIAKYRYYKYEVSETQGSSLIQFAEFDLLDQNLEELANVQIYAGTESSISHENWDNLTDGDLSTKYCSSFSGKATFFFDAGEAVEPFAYRIGTANDAASISSRNPLCWTLSVSNTYNTDNAHASWTLIDEQVGNNPLPSANKTLCDYMLLHAVTDLSMTYPEVNIPLGETALLSVEIMPKSMAGIPLEWHSSDEQTATVDANGRVKAVSLGQCLITASAPDYSSEVAECKVNVVREMPGFQYFLLAIDDVQNGNSVQFSEFDLLLPDMSEQPSISMYASTGEYFSNEVPENVVDNNLSTKWCGPFTNTVFLYFDAGMLLRPTGYRIYTAGDTEKYSGRNPSSWRLYGSRTRLSSPEDEGWILLDERVDDSTIGASNLTPYDFLIDYSQVPDNVVGVDAEATKDSPAVYDLWGRRWKSLSEAQKTNRIVISKGKKWIK
ncbi:MAG: Ig-like domain-containing protein, partial [Paraprevotella sp.]|nr:Ig-like domain-containing protein [Paraprevotella sp.]